MSEDVIRKEFEKLFPKENKQAYRNHLVNKYGEDEFVNMENVVSIVSEILNDVISESMK